MLLDRVTMMLWGEGFRVKRERKEKVGNFVRKKNPAGTVSYMNKYVFL